ncbi:hypothetical protein [Legionella sp. km772]|uniref:hypothetical protein n=1 Tax=Legionella sp. km772 TaxID=2498111 RepID=UPI000F8C4ADD|nr:hypothetical protein [Legionella sp. km772]RUR13908.1 hypothetical protein ELY15_01205 [Legionella sp. km772]
MQKIDRALTGLNSNIGKIEQHHAAEAHQVATDLLAQLQKARQNHEKHLLLGMNKEHAQKIFANACEKAINQAKPTLERDLGWGDYLTNLAIRLVNAVIAVVTINYFPTVFKPIQTKSLEAVEKLQEELGTRPTVAG